MRRVTLLSYCCLAPSIFISLELSVDASGYMICSNVNMSDQQTCSWQFLVIVMFFAIFASIPIFIINGVYNRYFHPLAGFPGPFWSSITDLAKLSALSSSDITAFSLELHQKYGMISCGIWTSSHLVCSDYSDQVPLSALIQTCYLSATPRCSLSCTTRTWTRMSFGHLGLLGSIRRFSRL